MEAQPVPGAVSAIKNATGKMPLGILSEPRFSCALGAQQTVLAIPKGIPIIHAGPGCSSKAFSFVAGGAGFQGDGYAGGSNVPSSNMTEHDVVFGGEGKLHSLVEAALEVMKGDLFVILAGCTSGIIGDDVRKVARSFAEAGHPVVGIESSGFRGNNYFGHELVLEGIIDQLLPDTVLQLKPFVVNVFASVPYQDAFWRSDLEGLKRLLEQLGLTVNILFGAGSCGIAEWRGLPDAQANIVVSPWVGLSAARKLRERFGTPFLHCPVFPVGARATSEFLRTVADFVGVDTSVLDAVIAHEEKRYYDYFISLANFIVDMHNNIPHEAHIVADSHYGLGLADFLVNDLGFDLKSLLLVDDPSLAVRKSVEQVASGLGQGVADALEFLADGYAAQECLKARIGEAGSAAIFGSTWETDLAKGTNSLLIHVSLPINDDVIVTRGYFGYDGGLRLMEDIYAGIFRKGRISYMTLLQ
ncbi:MAG: hypothetical protein LBG81_04115 [Coriobacteriaceae bacterium]|jgi:nitrogenase molybdenum-iron protein beta chain|nr:hypothetical protein [Coriobacteriaceae bacterium]